MKKSLLTIPLFAIALVMGGSAASADTAGDAQVTIERATPRQVVEGFAETCLRGFPDWKRFVNEIKRSDRGFQLVEGSRDTGHEIWRSRQAVVTYDHRVRSADAGAPHCSYVGLSQDPIDHELVSGMVQSALNKHLGMVTKRRAGPGQFGWYWNNGTDTGFGDNSRIYLLYNYSDDPDDRRISLSLQIRKAG